MSDDIPAWFEKRSAAFDDIATPQVDAASLEASIAAIENVLRDAARDPEHPFYGRDDLQELARRNIERARLAGNVPEVHETPLQALQREHDETYNRPLHPALAETIEQRRLELEAMPDYQRGWMKSDLIKEIGEPEYNRLVVQAQAALKPGQKLPEALKSDAITLRLLAAQARFAEQGRRTRPR